jgi:hypothetical protein
MNHPAGSYAQHRRHYVPRLQEPSCRRNPKIHGGGKQGGELRFAKGEHG